MGTLIQLCLGMVYAWSFFQIPIMKAYGWSNMQVTWAFSIAIFMLGVGAALGGINLPKYGPRALALTGGIFYASGYFMSAYAFSVHSLPLFYLGYGLLGGIGLGLAYVTPVAAASKLFPDKQGLVTGMVVMGFGFGALLMSKILGPAFMSVTNGNLVLVFVYCGIFISVFLTIAALFLQIPPVNADMLHGHKFPAGDFATLSTQGEMTMQQCVISPKFIMMWLIFFFNIVAGIMFISFQSPLLQDLLKVRMNPSSDFNDREVVASLAAAGATLIAISSLFNGLGRLFWGGLSDKIGRIQTFRLILGTQLAVFLLLLVVENPWVFGVFVCYVLLCYGGGFGTMPSFIKDVFGIKLMPVVYGAILTAWGCAGIVGPQIVAYMKDNFTETAGARSFQVAAGILLTGLIISLFLKNDRLAVRAVE